MNSFESDLRKLINFHSMESASNTPDFILAQYMFDCLNSFNRAVTSREKWYGRDPIPVDVPPQTPL